MVKPIIDAGAELIGANCGNGISNMIGIVEEIRRTIRELNDAGMTILLVEQMATLALKLAHRAYVLQTGTVVLEGTGKELLQHPEVVKAYLGG